MRSFLKLTNVIAVGVLMAFPLAGIASAGQPPSAEGKRRNVIFLIGDGMGLSHVTVAATVAKEPLALERSTAIGLAKTASASKYVTDSAAGGTALASGVKTVNGALGLTADLKVARNLLEYAQENGKATGVVVTCSVTHATPAAFVAHQPKRTMQEEIAVDFLESKIDLFIGGGRQFFEKRKDGQNLSNALKNKGFRIAYTLDEVIATESGKLAALLADDGLPPASEGRGAMLKQSVEAAIRILNQNPNGFVMMVEGSQIDWAAHRNEIDYVTSETIDFDDALKAAMDFADRDGNTLVVVTADHETGGLAVLDGDHKARTVKAGWATKGHSGTMVPVYAYGAGASSFSGIYENTGVFDRILAFLGYQSAPAGSEYAPREPLAIPASK